MFKRFCVMSTFIMNILVANQVIPVAIVGSGCAGFAAAQVTSEHGYKTIIFSGEHIGGDLNVKTEVGNWLGISTTYGNTIMPKVMNQSLSWGATLINDTVVKIDTSIRPFKLHTQSGKVYQVNFIIFATGTRERSLEIKGSEACSKYLWNNWDIHRNMELFLSLARGKDIVVLGGGIDAMKKVVIAVKAGARSVTLLARGKKLNMPEWRKRFISFGNKIKIQYNTSVVSISEKLNGVDLETNNHGKIYADLVILSIGRLPNSQLLSGLVTTDSKGFIVVSKSTYETSIKGIYACGDVTDAVGCQPQALIAVGSGMMAGYSVVEDLLLKDIPTEDVFLKKIKSAFFSKGY